MKKMLFNKDGLALGLGKDLKDLSGLYLSRGPAFTFFADEDPIAICGLNILWPGTGEAWALFGEGYDLHGIFIHRGAVKLLNEVAIKNKMIRIQATADKDNKTAIAWLFALGFKYEGEAEAYFQGKTYARFVRIYRENLCNTP